MLDIRADVDIIYRHDGRMVHLEFPFPGCGCTIVMEAIYKYDMEKSDDWIVEHLVQESHRRMVETMTCPICHGMIKPMPKFDC